MSLWYWPLEHGDCKVNIPYTIGYGGNTVQFDPPGPLGPAAKINDLTGIFV